MSTVLELRNVTKAYPGHQAVGGISLRVEQGSFFSLLGPSGCGKTTTLRLVGGFEQPTSGEIFLSGRAVNGLPPYKRNVSTVFQSYALFPHLNVFQNVAFGLEQRSEKDVRLKVDAILEMVQLTGKRDRRPAQLSGGEKQRAALARSLVLTPDVLLLDEPLAALDLKLRKAMRAELKRMQRSTGITFLFVTHDQEEAMAMSDQIAIMNTGRVEQIGTPEEVYRFPATRFVAGFLGDVNWIGGIGIRPQALRVSCGAQGNATVEQTLFLGNCNHVIARMHSGETVTAETPPCPAAFQPGQTVQVEWSIADEMTFGS